MSDFDFSDRTKKQFASFEDLPKFDLGGYNSPITMFVDQMRVQQEGEVFKAVQHVGVTVDKDELLKALAYDREQYEKGYRDAQSKLKPMCKYFTKCMSHPDISREYHDWCILYEEDCNCQCCSRKA